VRPQDIRRALDQVSGKGVEPVRVPLSAAVLDSDGLALDVAEVVQALLETSEAEPTGRVSWFEHADSGHLPCRLRAGGERCR